MKRRASNPVDTFSEPGGDLGGLGRIDLACARGGFFLRGTSPSPNTEPSMLIGIDDFSVRTWRVIEEATSGGP